ncbi:MAG: type VI secretion system contractile sheath protein TssC [Saprospiraceae bacterium]
METNPQPELKQEQSAQPGLVNKLSHKPADLNALKPFGGFDIVISTIEDAKYLNPTGSKALKETFLKDKDNAVKRGALKNRLQLMLDVLNASKNPSETVELFQKGFEKSTVLLNANLKEALEKTEELESSYRQIDLFFKNTGNEKIKNLTLVNAHKSQIMDLDNPQVSSRVREEFAANYDRIDMRQNYSLLVIPGYLGSNAVLDHWGEIALKNKVMMVTDMEDLDTPEDVVSLFEAKDHAGGSAYKSNMLMTSNWVIGRKGEEQVRDGNPLYIGASAALAGKMYTGNIAQPKAGFKFGILEGIDGVKFNLKLSEIGELEKLGLIPMVFERGKVFAYSAKTLFNGDNLGLQTYSVVRVFDWVAKVMMDFLNRRAFENVDFNTIQELKKQISKFLNSIKGTGNIIEDFTITKFEQDPTKKDRILLDISLKPFFAARSFTLGLDGTKGDDNAIDWNSNVSK